MYHLILSISPLSVYITILCCFINPINLSQETNNFNSTRFMWIKKFRQIENFAASKRSLGQKTDGSKSYSEVKSLKMAIYMMYIYPFHLSFPITYSHQTFKHTSLLTSYSPYACLCYLFFQAIESKNCSSQECKISKEVPSCF